MTSKRGAIVWGLAVLIGVSVGAVPQACAGSSGITLGQSGTMSGKAWRGLVNVATGVLELPRQMWVQNLRERNDGMNPFTALIDGVILGGLKGTVSALARTGSGVYDVLTFPLSYPKGFGALYHPETVFEAPWSP